MDLLADEAAHIAGVCGLVTREDQLLARDTRLHHIIVVKENIFACQITDEEAVVLVVEEELELSCK